MVLINTLSYLLYFIGCILATISVSLLHDVFLSKNVIKTYLLKKIQTLVITLTLLATIFKYLIDLQDKYILVSDQFARFIILLIPILILLLFFYFNNTHKITKKHKKNKSKNSKKPNKKR